MSLTEWSSSVHFLDNSVNQSIDFGKGYEGVFIDPDSSLFEKPLSTTIDE